MTEKDLKRGKQIQKNLETLNLLGGIMKSGFPKMTDSYREVWFADLDTVTWEKFKTAVLSVVDERKAALKKEFEEL